MADSDNKNRFAPVYPSNYLRIDDDGRLSVYVEAPLDVTITEPLEVEVSNVVDVNIQNNPLDVLIANADIAVTIAQALSVLTTRTFTTADVQIQSGTSTSASFDMRLAAGGTITIPSGFSGIMHFETSPDNATWSPFETTAGVPVTITNSPDPSVQSKTFPLPDSLFGAGYVRCRSYTDATRTSAQNQGSTLSIGVTLKS